MCYAKEDEIKKARKEQSVVACPQCHKPLAEHTTIEETGLKLIYDRIKEKVQVGDVVMLFPSTWDAENYARFPFQNAPRMQPNTRSFVASGYIGKTVKQMSDSIPWPHESIVLVRRVGAPKPYKAKKHK